MKTNVLSGWLAIFAIILAYSVVFTHMDASEARKRSFRDSNTHKSQLICMWICLGGFLFLRRNELFAHQHRQHQLKFN